MDYYKTNAVYKLLEDRLENGGKRNGLVWPGGGTVLLVYGDAKARPKFLSLVFDVGDVPPQCVIDAADYLAHLSGLPARHLDVDTNDLMQEKIRTWDNGDHKKVSLLTLKNMLFNCGLPVCDGGTKKALNTKTTNVYHTWVRENLGDRICVVDVDLIRMGAGTIKEICELKRSVATLGNWQPYKVDYKNFNLICNLSKLVGADFNIVYNRMTKKPPLDNAREFSIFSFDNSKRNPVEPLGRFLFDDFCDERHL